MQKLRGKIVRSMHGMQDPALGQMTAEPPKRPQGRRELGKALRRDRILEIARLSFWEKGYERTTMSGIAETLGGSKATLWSYFDSKEALFEAVIDRAVMALREDMVAALEVHGPVRQVLNRFAQSFIHAITTSDALALQRMIIGEGARFARLGLIFFEKGPKTVATLLADFLGERMGAGSIRSAPPAAAASMLLSLCSGGLHQRILWGIEAASAGAVEREADSAVDFFLQVFADRQDERV